MVVRLERHISILLIQNRSVGVSQLRLQRLQEPNRLVVEAMSGFGEPPHLSSPVPFLRQRKRGGRIVYACRTKRQVFRVMEEIGRIQTRIPLRTVYLFSKNDYCLLKETSSFPIAQDSFKWYCSFNVTNNLCSYFLNLSLVNRELTSLVNRFSPWASLIRVFLRLAVRFTFVHTR